LAGRLTIVGGGVMGLMNAYQAAPLAESVTVLEVLEQMQLRREAFTGAARFAA
jgi:glycine/D-amino acid oxidase-like deaminating enzyme